MAAVVANAAPRLMRRGRSNSLSIYTFFPPSIVRSRSYFPFVLHRPLKIPRSGCRFFCRFLSPFHRIRSCKATGSESGVVEGFEEVESREDKYNGLQKQGEEMTIATSVRISADRRLDVRGCTVLSGVPENVTLTSASDSSPVDGVFIGAHSLQPACRHVVSLGTLRDVRFMACFRFKLWWMSQRMGDRGRDIPLETQFLLLEIKNDSSSETSYSVFLPLIDGSFRSSLHGSARDELELCIESGDAITAAASFSAAAFLTAGHSDPFAAISDAIAAARSHLQTFRLRVEKKLPPIVDLFGWCTWDAFYQEVTQEGVESGLQTLAEGGSPPKFVIIDDGWQSVDTEEEDNKSSLMRLAAIKENSKFQNKDTPEEGIKSIVDVAKQRYGLSHVYVWHAMTGYWGGVRPSAKGMEHYLPAMKYPQVSPGVEDNEPGMKTDPLTVHGLGLVDPPEVSSAVELLLELVALIPARHYLIGSAIFLLVFLYNFLECHLLGDIVRGFRGDKVRVTYNSASDIYQDVVSKCRILHGRYLVTPWLSSPHFQTTFLNFFGNPPSFTYRRKILRLSDGGTIALDWVLSSDVAGSSFNPNKVILKEDATPIAIMVPGLSSDSSSPYMKHLVYKIAKRGWHVVVSNHRGLGGVSITSDCFYNAGWTEDIRKVINHLHIEYPMAVLYAVGSSVGGNILVKYLGEEGEGTPLAGGASICSPWDLVVCDRFISRKLVQKLYNRALVVGLKGYAQLHRPVMSRLGNWEGIKRSNSVRDFDSHATCLVGNYETVDTFYRCCSSVNFVGNVAIPLLCISSLDDPICTREAIPWDECRVNKNIVLATTVHGGHLGFFQGIRACSLWWVDAVDEFLGVLHSSPFVREKKKVYADGLHTTLDSSIDKAPYVNVMEDGMVATVGNDLAIQDESEEQIDHGQSQSQTPISVILAAQQEENTGSLEQRENDQSSASHVTAAEPSEKSRHQLSRWNTWSIWLLVYIAIMTTWPLVGSTLLTVFKKRFKRPLPRLSR